VNNMKKAFIFIIIAGMALTGCHRKREFKPKNTKPVTTVKQGKTEPKTTKNAPEQPVRKPEAKRQTYPKDPVRLYSLSEMNLDANAQRIMQFLGSAAMGRTALRAIKAMGKDGNRLLVRALRWSNPNGRMQAAIIAAKLKVKDKQVIGLMIENLLRDPDPDCRSRTATAFVDLKEKAAGPALLQMVKQDPHPMARANAIWALGAMHYRPAIPELIKNLSAKDTWVRLRTASALKKMHPRQAVTAIKEQLKKEKNPLVKKRLLQTLRACKGHR